MHTRYRQLLMLITLSLVSLACGLGSSGVIDQAADKALEELDEAIQTETGLTLEEIQGTAEAAADNVQIGEDVETEFPIADGATNVISVAGSLNYTSDLTIDEAVAFYRNALTNQGLTERDLLTIIEESTVSMVFDGHSSGQAIVVQMVDLGPAGLNINVRFEDV